MWWVTGSPQWYIQLDDKWLSVVPYLGIAKNTVINKECGGESESVCVLACQPVAGLCETPSCWSRELGFWGASVPCAPAACLLYFWPSNYVRRCRSVVLQVLSQNLALASPWYLTKAHSLPPLQSSWWKTQEGPGPGSQCSSKSSRWLSCWFLAAPSGDIGFRRKG